MSYSNTFGHQHSTGKSTWHVGRCTKYRYNLFKSLYHKNICMIALDEAAKKIGVILLEKEVTEKKKKKKKKNEGPPHKKPKSKEPPAGGRGGGVVQGANL